MLKKILLSVLAIAAVLVIGLLIAAAMQPDQFHIERSATMAAPPEAVFAQVNDFHKWDAWSPWLKVDPNAKSTFEGPSSGEGAVFRWAGNAEVGEGSMTILESKPHESIHIQLAFKKPFENVATSDFIFKPVGDKTDVTWSMDGKNNFMSKVICLFLHMDELIGGKYEEGLANLKAIVERPPAESAGEGSAASPAEEPAHEPATESAAVEPATDDAAPLGN